MVEVLAVDEVARSQSGGGKDQGGRRLLPVEVKAGRAVRVDDAKWLDSFCEEFPSRAPFGLLLYDGIEALALTKRTIAVPFDAVL